MPVNFPGLLVPFQLLVYPRLAVPHITIRDIRQLDFSALRKAGYRGAVFDKDNCLTIPHKDILIPELQGAWKSCRESFGNGNVIIVSNSAGTRSDPGAIQAESVEHHLEVPVIRHQSRKPSYSTIKNIRTYFSSLKSPIEERELVVVGDRIFTDVVMANRIRWRHSDVDSERAGSRHPQGPLAVWTSDVWQREATLMRWFEKQLLKGVLRWTTPTSADVAFLSDAQNTFVKSLPN